MSTPLDMRTNGHRAPVRDGTLGRTSTRPAATQASSSAGSIAVNALLLYVAHHVLEWQVGWITPAWSEVLWAVDLTLEVSIVASVLSLLVRAGWFRNLAGAVSCAFAVLGTGWVYVVFPFDFGSAVMNDLARFVLVLALIATVIATLVTALVGIVALGKAVLRSTLQS